MDIFLPSVDQKRKLFHYQDLNQIILEKDSIVQGLQDEVDSVPRGTLAPVPAYVHHQVVELTGREGRVLEGCLHKDRQIDAQYSALAGLNNLTVLQVYHQSKTLFAQVLPKKKTIILRIVPPGHTEQGA